MAAYPSKLRWLVLLVFMPMLATAQFGYWTNNGTITISQYYGSGGAVIIPSSINGLPVTTIGNYTFQNNQSITSVTFPDSITNIELQAFYDCTNLSQVTFSNSPASIGSSVFAYCSSLTNCVLGTSITGIGDYAFSESGLVSAALPDSVTDIGNEAFSYCASLANVTIGSGVQNIGDNAFSDCTSLGEIYFAGNAPSTGWAIFLNDAATVFYLPGTTGWGTNFGGSWGLDLQPTAPWLPKIIAGGSGFGVHTNQFGFNVNWASGRTIIVEACTNLANPAWTPLQTNILASGLWHFDDPGWTNQPRRMYRIKSP